MVYNLDRHLLRLPRPVHRRRHYLPDWEEQSHGQSGVIFPAYASAHNKLESVRRTLSSLEPKVASSKEGEHRDRIYGKWPIVL